MKQKRHFWERESIERRNLVKGYLIVDTDKLDVEKRRAVVVAKSRCEGY